MNDRQKNKVYAWEDKHIGPHDKSMVPYEKIEGIVAHVWAGEGLQYPPKVKPLPKQKRCLGDATRMAVRFHKGESVPTWVILHELAHSMTSNIDDESNRHGALFVGTYILLASKYLGIKLSDLTASARDAKLGIKLGTVSEF